MGQYQSLNQIEAAYNSGDVVTAATLYTSLDSSAITDPTMQSRLQNIKSYMEGNVYQTLANMGTNEWNSGNLEQALKYYQLSIAIRQEPENMYLYARLQQAMGKTEDANKLFDQIVGEHPDSPYAERARQARGY